MKGYWSLFGRLMREEDGQDMIEYTLLAGFIALVATAAISSIGSEVNIIYEEVANQIPAAPGGGGS